VVDETVEDSGVSLGKVELLPNMQWGIGLIGLNARSNNGLGKMFNNSSFLQKLKILYI
jgi:hypothetical protein